ncbi:biotin synthase BioB [Thermovibrio sp.]
MRSEVLEVLNLSEVEVYFYLLKAFNLKLRHFGNFIETCGILNAKSGKCPSDCKFCAQSAKFNLPIKTYPLLGERELYERAKEAFSLGINRFSFVISGISPTKKDLKVIGAVIEKLKGESKDFKLCASLGQLSKEDLKFLKECGLDRYHHNLETSREFYPQISKAQKWEDRFKTVLRAKEVGLSVCCGGIFGLGESERDVASLIETLKELNVDSVPVNFLHPIKGTPLEGANYLTPLKCLKILTALRLFLSNSQIRVCGGREYNLRELQPLALLAVDSLMVGNYLTTKGRGLREDKQMIEDMGFKTTLKA